VAKKTKAVKEVKLVKEVKFEEAEYVPPLRIGGIVYSCKEQAIRGGVLPLYLAHLEKMGVGTEEEEELP
jgi:hypothetical protein